MRQKLVKVTILEESLVSVGLHVIAIMSVTSVPTVVVRPESFVGLSLFSLLVIIIIPVPRLVSSLASCLILVAVSS